MRTVEIPGGVASFREQGKDEIPIRSQKVLGAAIASARSHFSATPELFEPLKEGETQESRAERLGLESAALSPAQALSLMTLQEATVVALLAEWTIGRPLPTLDNLDQLGVDLYTALMDAVGGIAASEDLDTPDFSVQPMTAEGSPTLPSPSSDGRSEGEAVANPIPTSPPATGSTATAV